MGEKASRLSSEQVVADLLRLGELLALHSRPIGALGLGRRIRQEESERLKAEIAELEKRIETQAYEDSHRALRSVLGLRKDEVLDLIFLRCIAVVAFEALDNFRQISTVAGVSKAVGLGDWSSTLDARHAIRQAIIKGHTISYSEEGCEGGVLKAGRNLIRFLSGDNRLGILWTEESIRLEKEEFLRRQGNALKRTSVPDRLSKPVPASLPLPPASLKGCESPKAIFNALRQSVLGMDDTDTLRRFSVAMSLHMRRANLVRQGIVPTTPCQTLCIAGESGVGKTFMVEEFCKIANLPYTIGNLAEVTCSGYAGLDLTDIFLGLLRNGAKRADVEAGSIVFLDEADKRKINENRGDFDCTGAALQAELLRMVEGTDIQLGGRRSNSGSGVMLSSRGLAFCLAGCFSGVTEAMASKKRHLGFGSSVENVSHAPDIREALTTYFLPELCNRISTILYIKPPALPALIKIAIAPHGVLAKQNQFLAGIGLTLKPGEDVIREICAYAHSSKTYARGVRSLFQALAEEAIFEEWKGELVIGAGEVRKAIDGLRQGVAGLK